MKIDIGECCSCGKNLPLVNKTKKLCNQCNRIRLGTKTSIPTFKKSPIKPFSTKGKRDYLELKKIKDSITQDALERNEYICSGCLKQGVNLDRSHNVPISFDSSLKLDKENITLLCRECHDKWYQNVTPDVMPSQLAQMFQDLEFRSKYAWGKSYLFAAGTVVTGKIFLL